MKKNKGVALIYEKRDSFSRANSMNYYSYTYDGKWEAQYGLGSGLFQKSSYYTSYYPKCTGVPYSHDRGKEIATSLLKSNETAGIKTTILPLHLFA